jgi:hypothetical protein
MADGAELICFISRSSTAFWTNFYVQDSLWPMAQSLFVLFLGHRPLFGQTFLFKILYGRWRRAYLFYFSVIDRFLDKLLCSSSSVTDGEELICFISRLSIAFWTNFSVQVPLWPMAKGFLVLFLGYRSLFGQTFLFKIICDRWRRAYLFYFSVVDRFLDKLFCSRFSMADGEELICFISRLSTAFRTNFSVQDSLWSMAKGFLVLFLGYRSLFRQTFLFKIICDRWRRAYLFYFSVVDRFLDKLFC